MKLPNYRVQISISDPDNISMSATLEMPLVARDVFKSDVLDAAQLALKMFEEGYEKPETKKAEAKDPSSLDVCSQTTPATAAEVMEWRDGPAGGARVPPGRQSGHRKKKRNLV